MFSTTGARIVAVPEWVLRPVLIWFVDAIPSAGIFHTCIQLRNLFVCVSYSRRHSPSLAAQAHAAPAGGHVSACDAHAQGRVAHARRVGNNACAYARRVASRCAIMARASSRCSCQTPCGRQGRPRAARARTARGTATHVVALDASRARGLFQERTFLIVCVLRCAPQFHTLTLRCVILCAQDGGNKYSVPWTSVDMTIGEFKQAASIVLGAQCAFFLFMFSLRNLSLHPRISFFSQPRLNVSLLLLTCIPARRAHLSFVPC